jgi:hypothetical protein
MGQAMTQALGAHMTRRQIEQIFREHDQAACLASVTRIARCRVCSILNAQFIDGLREIMGKKPLTSPVTKPAYLGKRDRRKTEQLDAVRFASFGGADSSAFDALQSGRTPSGMRLRSGSGG